MPVCSIQELTQPLLRVWPLCRHDRVARGVASYEVRGHPMSAENPLELSADAFEGSA
jgi:hypothetical protein